MLHPGEPLDFDLKLIPAESVPTLPLQTPSGATVRVRNVVISVVAVSAARVDATVAGMVSRGAEILA